MKTLTFEWDETLVESFTLVHRREDIPRIKRCDVHLSSAFGLRDKFDRGIGQVSAMGYGDTLPEAYADALPKLVIKIEERLAECNAREPGAVPKGISKDDAAADLFKLLDL